MQGKLIAELREWVSGFEASINHQKNGDDEVYCFFVEDDIKEFHAILSRHEAEPKEDSLEAWENEAKAFYKATGYLRPGKDPGIIGDEDYREMRDKAWKIWSAGWCYRNDNPTPDKPTEPLEELAKRKGRTLWIRMNGWSKTEADNFPTLDTARAYLEALPDKGGSK